jgi:predicted RNA-binding protein with EMAP domain
MFGVNPTAPFGPQQQYGGYPVQQLVQLLQAVPHQLQNLQQLAYLQQQQLQQIQQLLQLIPAQLSQLQQLQQSPSFQQPFGSALGVVPTAPMGPQLFGQPGQVM